MQAYHYRISAKEGYILCDEAGIKTALEVADVNLPFPKSSVYVPGRSYTFRSDRELSPSDMEVVADLLRDECGEVSIQKVFK